MRERQKIFMPFPAFFFAASFWSGSRSIRCRLNSLAKAMRRYKIELDLLLEENAAKPIAGAQKPRKTGKPLDGAVITRDYCFAASRGHCQDFGGFRLMPLGLSLGPRCTSAANFCPSSFK